VPCPSRQDRKRNTHRAGRAWGKTTVATIVGNPRYKGDDAYGRYRKVERLYDRADASAGFVSKLVPADESTWVIVEGSLRALVGADEWASAQADRTPSSKGGRRPDQPSRYALRGLVFCHQCGHPMQGNAVGRAVGRVVLHYRCTYRSEYPGDTTHPRSLAVAEAWILPVLDGWLGRLFDPDHIDETVDILLTADRRDETDPPDLIEARRLTDDAQARLARHVAAIDAGVDPGLLVEQTRRAQADLARAKGIIAAHAARSSISPLSPSAIRSVLLRHQGLPGLLRDVATPDERRQLYHDLGVTLTYERRSVRTEAQDLIRPSLSLPQTGTKPWSNRTCRRGEKRAWPTPVRDHRSPPHFGCLTERNVVEGHDRRSRLGCHQLSGILGLSQARALRLRHGPGCRTGGHGGLDSRGKNFAECRPDPDAPGRLAEGSLQAPRPAIEAVAAAWGEREDGASRPPVFPHQPQTLSRTH
jgi:hypothetical protein